jgi:hypothetical protein
VNSIIIRTRAPWSAIAPSVGAITATIARDAARHAEAKGTLRGDDPCVPVLLEEDGETRP